MHQRYSTINKTRWSAKEFREIELSEQKSMETVSLELRDPPLANDILSPQNISWTLTINWPFSRGYS